MQDLRNLTTVIFETSQLIGLNRSFLCNNAGKRLRVHWLSSAYYEFIMVTLKTNEANKYLLYT